MYSPKELELYLIDFKKGVEFKTYAAYQLAPCPGHRRRVGARVRPQRACSGSTSSSRTEATSTATGRPGRGQLSPDHGRLPASDLAPGGRVSGVLHRGRQALARGKPSLLLDRLVRQGRAFGIHVTLGSQTLGWCLFVGPNDDRPDGHPDRLAVLRGRLAPDPQRGQRRRPAPDSSWRGDLQRRQRDGRREPHLPGCLAPRRQPRGATQGHSRRWPRIRG